MPLDNESAPLGGSGAPSKTQSQVTRPQYSSSRRSRQGLSLLRLTALRIETKSDGTYRVDPEGRLAVVVLVRDRYGEIVDTVAFFPDKPEQGHLRYGDATPILGARALAMAAGERRPLTLWETPEHWLINCRGGAVVLDWSVNLRPLFTDIPSITCESQALRDRLLQNFLRFAPKLTVSPVNCRVGRGAQSA